MPRQLNCRGMCKIETWSGNNFFTSIMRICRVSHMGINSCHLSFSTFIVTQLHIQYAVTLGDSSHKLPWQPASCEIDYGALYINHNIVCVCIEGVMFMTDESCLPKLEKWYEVNPWNIMLVVYYMYVMSECDWWQSSIAFQSTTIVHLWLKLLRQSNSYM